MIKLRATRERTPTSMAIELPHQLNASAATVTSRTPWRHMKCVSAPSTIPSIISLTCSQRQAGMQQKVRHAHGRWLDAARRVCTGQSGSPCARRILQCSASRLMARSWGISGSITMGSSDRRPERQGQGQFLLTRLHARYLIMIKVTSDCSEAVDLDALARVLFPAACVS